MLGRRPDPGLFGSANLLDLDRLDGTVYGQLARSGRQLFTDYQFRGVYSKRGRPSASPALMALSCLLQHHEKISDDAVIERLKFDLRWKAALDLDPLADREGVAMHGPGTMKEQSDSTKWGMTREQTVEIVKQAQGTLTQIEMDISRSKLERETLEHRLRSVIEQHMTMLEMRRQANANQDNLHVMPNRVGNEAG